MRRNVILGGGPRARPRSAAATSATSFRPTPTWRPRPPARQLSSERLAQILASGGKGVKINRETADFVANVWIDYALFGQAVARGQAADRFGQRRRGDVAGDLRAEGRPTGTTRLMARRSSVSDAAVDSLYRAPTCGCCSTSCSACGRATDASQQAAAPGRRPRPRWRRSGRAPSFGALAVQLSEDPGSKADSGYLPPSPQGRFVPAFDSAGWSLAPGAGERAGGDAVRLSTSSSGPSRPRPKRASGRYLSERAGVRLDSLYMDSLAAANKIEVVCRRAGRDARGASSRPTRRAQRRTRRS